MYIYICSYNITIIHVMSSFYARFMDAYTMPAENFNNWSIPKQPIYRTLDQI